MVQQAALRDRDAQEPRHHRAQAARGQEARRIGRLHVRAMAAVRQAQRHRRGEGRSRNIGPVRADARRGQIDAALGYSFRLYVDLKDRGVPVDDIVLMPMANYGLKLYGNAVIVNPKFAAEKPEAVKASCTPSCRVSRRRSGTRRRPSSRSPSATTRRNGRSSSSGCAWPSGTTSSRPRPGRRPRRGRDDAAGRIDRPDRAGPHLQGQAQARRYLRRFVPAAGGRAQAQLSCG